MDGSQPLDPRKTIFVGGVPRPLRAGKFLRIQSENERIPRDDRVPENCLYDQNHLQILFVPVRVPHLFKEFVNFTKFCCQ